MSGFISIRRFLLLVLLLNGLALTALINLPHLTYIRYQGFNDTIFARTKWIYERIAYDERPIDILIIGSSRSARGMKAADIEKALKERGLYLRVENISLPSSGFDSRIVLLEEALAHHPEIKRGIWGLVEAFPRDGHQIFADVAPAPMILRSPWIINRNLPQNLARLPYRQLELSVATFLPEVFGRQHIFQPAHYVGTTPDLKLFNNPAWTADAELAQITAPTHTDELSKKSKRRKREITWPIYPASLSWMEFGVSQFYIKQLAHLSETHDFQIAFSFLPFFDGFDAPIEEEWLMPYGPVWKASFLKDNPGHYADAAHASILGMELISPWLADHISSSITE